MSDEFIHTGLTSFLEENYKTAIDQFTKSLEKNNSNIKAFIYRACSYIKQGNYQSAFSDLENASKINASCYDVVYNRARVNFLMGNLAAFKEDLNIVNGLNDLSDEQKSNIDQLSEKLN